MNTHFITTEEELIAVKEDWNRLVQSSPETDMPFYSWDWFYRSWIHFGKPERRKLYVVAVYENEHLIGILPLVSGQRKSSGFSYRMLHFCNTGMMPRNTMYTDSSQNQVAVFRAAWDYLFEYRSIWDMLGFANLLDSSSFHRFVLEGEHDAGYAMIQTRGLTSPFVALEGQTYDEYFTQYGNKDARRRFKRFTEKCESEGKHWEMKIYENESDIQTGIDLALAVRRESWKGAFRDEDSELFYRELFANFAAKHEVLIPILTVDNIPIAAQFITNKNGLFFLHTNDYHTGYRDSSPGNCLLHLMLIEAFKRQWKVFDFTGGDYTYKKESCTGYQNHSTFQVFHSGWKSRIVYSAKTFWLPLIRKIFRKPADKDFISKKLLPGRH